MRFTYLAPITFTPFLFLFPILSNSSDLQAPSAQNMKRLAEAPLRTENPHLASLAYARLFAKAGAGGTRALRAHESDEIALRAAWEEILLRIPETTRLNAVRPDQRLLQRFVGFVEGRLRANVPKWWEDTLLDAQAYSRYNLCFPGFPGL